MVTFDFCCFALAFAVDNYQENTSYRFLGTGQVLS